LGEGKSSKPTGFPPGRGVMFSKDNEQLESFIGSGTEFQGELNVKGSLRVEGQFDGKVNAPYVILAETGVIKGEVSAKKIIIEGKVEGNLRVQEIVEIKATGKVLGDIFTKKISITEGAKVNGKIEMEVDEDRVIDFKSKGGEG
jgi:cytoskeletal protein CcmA (bactofilin family)